jgi:hypothetical protein
MTKPISEMTVDEIVQTGLKRFSTHYQSEVILELARRLEAAENRYADFRKWYDGDGSVGGLSQFIERHDAAMAKEKE